MRAVGEVAGPSFGLLFCHLMYKVHLMLFYEVTHDDYVLFAALLSFRVELKRFLKLDVNIRAAAVRFCVA